MFFSPINNLITPCGALVATRKSSTLGGDSGEASEQKHVVKPVIQTISLAPQPSYLWDLNLLKASFIII